MNPTVNNHTLITTLGNSINQSCIDLSNIKNSKTLSKDRLRDFHSERVMYLGNKKGYINAYKNAISKCKLYF